MRRFSKIFKKEENNEQQQKHGRYELIKINRHGARQQRTLIMTETGLSNMKGKSCKWHYPTDDVYCIEKDPKDPCRFVIKVLRSYQFEATSYLEANKIIKLFQQLYRVHTTNEDTSNFVDQNSENISLVSPRQVPTQNSAHSLIHAASPPQPQNTFETPRENRAQSLVPMVTPLQQKQNSLDTGYNLQSDTVQNSSISTIINNNFVINHNVTVNDFELIKILGRGSFSKVVLVRKKDNSKYYAMKILQKSELKKRNQVEHTNTEKKILATTTHPYIVKLYYSFQSSDKLYMVLEYVSGGEMFYHLKRAKRFPENLVCFYAAEVVLALEFLHESNIVYRDLKPENILVAADGHIKLTDFGLSKDGITSVGGINSDGVKTRSFCGTPDYLSPEIISGQPHGKAVDFWALGILIFEMLVGTVPFKGANRNELYEQTLKSEVIFPDFVSSVARSLITSLLAKRPEDRLGSRGFQDIKNHPFFSKIKFDKLLRKEIDPPFKPITVDNTIGAASESEKEKLDQVVLPSSPLKNYSSSPSFFGFSYNIDSALNLTNNIVAAGVNPVVSKVSMERVSSTSSGELFGTVVEE